MSIRLVQEDNGEDLKPGQEVRDFRDKLLVLVTWCATDTGERGRVTVRDGNGNDYEVYPSVICAKIVVGQPVGPTDLQRVVLKALEVTCGTDKDEYFVRPNGEVVVDVCGNDYVILANGEVSAS